ncbi:MAG: hypothetical protein R2784_16280 [Saprospiraceae bacterium]
MISIIVGTNRRDSEALTFARIYQDEIERQSGEKPGLVTLEHIPGNLWHPDMYDSDKQAPEIKQIQDELMIPAEKMVFVVPEDTTEVSRCINYSWMQYPLKGIKNF